MNPKPACFPFSDEVWQKKEELRTELMLMPTDEKGRALRDENGRLILSEKAKDLMKELEPYLHSREYDRYLAAEYKKEGIILKIKRNTRGNKRVGAKVLKRMKTGWRQKHVTNHR